MSETLAEIARLEKAIEERLAWIRQVFSFVVKLTHEHGKQTYYNQGSSNTHMIYQLCNFEGFSFEADTGQTMFGGNQVTIWYHPEKVLNELVRTTAVLSIYSQVPPPDRNTEVEEAVTPTGWLLCLNELMSHTEEYLARRTNQQKEAKTREREEWENKERLAELEEVAAKLKA